MRRLVIAAVAAAVLAGAPAAAAKEITAVTVCGADDCATTRDPTLMQAMMNGGPPAEPPAHPAGAYRLRARIAERPGGPAVARFTSWWVPDSSLLLSEDGSWMEIAKPAAAVVKKLSDGFAPFGPEKLGSTFAGTSSHAAPPPPVRNEPASDGGGASVDSWVIVLGAGIALAAAGAALVLVRRRPGGATP